VTRETGAGSGNCEVSGTSPKGSQDHGVPRSELGHGRHIKLRQAARRSTLESRQRLRRAIMDPVIVRLRQQVEVGVSHLSTRACVSSAPIRSASAVHAASQACSSAAVRTASSAAAASAAWQAQRRWTPVPPASRPSTALLGGESRPVAAPWTACDRRVPDGLPVRRNFCGSSPVSMARVASRDGVCRSSYHQRPVHDLQ
jgi:hypothetical protein